jgi:hypothetical protein
VLTVLGSNLASASPGQLALSAALAVLFAILGYRTSARYRALRGVTPWRVPSLAWALLCLVFPFIGLGVEILAELTTRSPSAPAQPPRRRAEGPSRYAPPRSLPVPLDPPQAVQASDAPLLRTMRAPWQEAGVPTDQRVRWPVPAPDAHGRPALFGWYPDPSARHELRYFDGRCWGEQVVDGEKLSIDPL